MLSEFFCSSEYCHNMVRAYQDSLDRQGMKETLDNWTRIDDGSNAFIYIEGPLFCRNHHVVSYTGGLTYGMISQRLKEYLFSAKVKAIFLVFNSPGGEAPGCQELASVIRVSSGLKPITALVQGQCMSAAYHLAAGCGRILLSSRVSEVGSIGVIVSRKKKTSTEPIASGDLKAAAYREKTAAREKYLRSVASQHLEEFLKDLVSLRGLTKEQAEKISSGRDFIGDDAINVGLADGYFDQFAWQIEKRVVEVDMSEQKKAKKRKP